MTQDTDQIPDEPQVSDILNASDDDILNGGFDQYIEEVDDEETPETEDPQPEADDEEAQASEEEADELDGEAEEALADETEEDDNDDPSEDTPVDGQDSEIVKKLFAPFQANGKEMQVDNVDDAIRLMQMGANYNKKMAALKPNLRLMKMLENNKLLSEEKLSYLIDLDKKDPSAISKLISEAGVDPLDLEIKDGTEYKPNTYTVDDREIALDEVLEDIKSTPTYSDMVEVISTKWDKTSRLALVNNPALIKAINQQMNDGVYKAITTEVDRMRTLGHLQGVSDIDAYQQVGDRLYAQHVANAAKEPAKAKADVSAVRRKKRAASSTKNKPTGKSKKVDLNPLAMSDEEIEKMTMSQFL